MAQGTYIQEGVYVDYTPSVAVDAGDVVVQVNLVGIATEDIAASTLGALAVKGIFDVNQHAEIIVAGDAVYWDANGDSVGGTAGAGCATATASGNTFMGFCQTSTAAATEDVRIALSSAEVVAGGIAEVTSLTGTASTLPIAGLEAAQGGTVSTTGGASTTSANAGGAVTLVGGLAGVTGVGGAASVIGGAGGSTSGTGGAVAIAGGAGTNGDADGGAVAINGGALDGSGTDGAITIGASNTASVTIGASGVLTAMAGPLQDRATEAITATTGGGTDGLITAGTKLAIVTSDSAAKQISLPISSVGDVINIYIASTGCELISAVTAHEINDVVVGETNELALVLGSLYVCKYVATNTWIVTGTSKLGAIEDALTPDTL